MSIHVSLVETWAKRLADVRSLAFTRVEDWLKILGFLKPVKSVKPSLAPCPTCPPFSFEGTKAKQDIAVEV